LIAFLNRVTNSSKKGATATATSAKSH